MLYTPCDWNQGNFNSGNQHWFLIQRIRGNHPEALARQGFQPKAGKSLEPRYIKGLS